MSPPPAHRVRGVFFDLDDTLFDHTGASGDAVWDWVQTLAGWPHDREQTVIRWQVLEARHFARYRAGEVTFAEQRRQRLRDFLENGADLVDADLDDAFTAYLGRYEERWRLVPDAVGVVERLLAGGYRVGILSNGQYEQQRRKLDRIGLTDPRIMLLTSDRLSAAKPSPLAFADACQRLDVLPAAALMVGDDLAADIEGARAAGLQALHLHRGRISREAESVPDLRGFTLPALTWKA